MAASQASKRQCPACHFDVMLGSHSRGFLEDLYFFLGGELWRCQKCEERHVFFSRFAIPLGKTNPIENTNDATNLWIITISIFGSIVLCLVVAFWTLRRLHRWPF